MDLIDAPYFYKSEQGVISVELGNGLVGICSMFFPGEKTVGICFTHGGNGVVGSQIPEKNLKNIFEAQAFLQIIATNPESLDVLIKQLLEAKTFFDKKNRPEGFQE